MNEKDRYTHCLCAAVAGLSEAYWRHGVLREDELLSEATDLARKMMTWIDSEYKETVVDGTTVTVKQTV